MVPQAGNKIYDEAFGKAAAPFVLLLDDLPTEKKNYPYHIFMDNLFTSFNILKCLKQRGYHGTGTIRDNRIPKDCPLPNKAMMKKMVRGTAVAAIEKEDGILVCKWVDNNVVSVASTANGLQPTTRIKRFCRKSRKNISVPQPMLIHQYNKYMGGTDRMDEDIGQRRISIRGKKWWRPLFTWLIDAAINNAWLTYRQVNPGCQKLEFRRSVVQCYLERYKTTMKSPGPSTSSGPRSSRVPIDIRYD